MARKKKVEEITPEITPEISEEAAVTISTDIQEDHTDEVVVNMVEAEEKVELPKEVVITDEEVEVSPKMMDPIQIKDDTVKGSVDLIITKDKMVKGTLEASADFIPSNDGWWTTSNDKKLRFSAGVYMNTQIGKYGTLRVQESGEISYIKHTDFAKTTKGLSGLIDTFVGVFRNRKEVLSEVDIFVKI